jgi:hypothetical protein
MCPARPQPLQGLAYECSLLYYGTPSPRRKIDSPLFAVYCWSQRTAKRTKKIMIFRTGRCTFRSTRVSSKVERVPRGTFQIPQSWLGLINSWKPDAKSSYIYRVQSSVLITHPLSTQRVCPPPAPKAGGGGTHSPGGEGVWGQYFERRQTLDGLLLYNSSTAWCIRLISLHSTVGVHRYFFGSFHQ